MGPSKVFLKVHFSVQEMIGIRETLRKVLSCSLGDTKYSGSFRSDELSHSIIKTHCPQRPIANTMIFHSPPY